MAECCAAWYFKRMRRARVIPNPASKANKNFDLVIERGGLTVNAEVKAPYAPQLNSYGAGDDAAVLRKKRRARSSRRVTQAWWSWFRCSARRCGCIVTSS
jgi:hypothetical protein